MIHVSCDHLGTLALTSVLGQGGMGKVWGASADGRTYAVKMLAPHLAIAPEARGRFEREVRLLRELHATNVVQVRDFGETEDGVPFMVMDPVPGESLDRILVREGPLTVARTAAIMAEVFRALDAVHHAGISHRDVKPANIMIHEKGGTREVTLGTCRSPPRARPSARATT
jgi:serine/threonine-protein kinase